MSIKSKIVRELEQKPCRMRELKQKLGNDKKVQLLLAQMERKGQVVKEKGLYRLQGWEQAPSAPAAEGVVCTLVKLAPRFGFAQREDGTGDVFLPGGKLLGAMPGDRVLVQLAQDPRVPGSMEGEVTAILQPRNRFVGQVVEGERGLALEPDCCPGLLLRIKKSADGGVKPGDKAAVEILERGSHHQDHLAGVCMRFGSSSRASQCAKAILYDHEIEPRFPEKVKAEARRLPEKLQEKELAAREDLRELPIFTIDSAQTKDIDDAIHVRQTATGFTLGVHIADVSHYVRPETALDEEAFRRGTSLYYADSVIPMLPKQLSNGLCSLNEGEDRLALSCLMELDKQGRIVDYRFAKTVIRSRVKGVYSEINTILDGTSDVVVDRKYQMVSAQFGAMRMLYSLRAGLRRARGGMEIESGESKLILNDKGICVEVKRRARGLSECMIEEFMLLANQCAAHLARVQKLPFVYRVHEEPSPERATALRDVLLACGLEPHFQKAIPAQAELAALLDQTRGDPMERVVHTAILRSMQKAKYEPEPKGHYGLSLEDYAHFTSPIRRYPDLAVHRILSGYLAGETAGELKVRYQGFVQDASEQSSARELEAMQVERTVESCYKAECMAAHLGERFEGIISGLTQRGLFVELPNTVEGFVPATELCSGEVVLTQGVRLSSPLTGQCWTLGGMLSVTVTKADVASGRVDLALAKPEG